MREKARKIYSSSSNLQIRIFFVVGCASNNNIFPAKSEGNTRISFLHVFIVHTES